MKYFLYSLEHIYQDEMHRDCKFIGYFDDLIHLDNVKIKALGLSGFCQYPDGFIVKNIILNKIHWEKGFKKIVGEIGRDYLEKSDLINKEMNSIKKLKLKSVFRVSHSYTINDFLDDERIVGVFLSEKYAKQAIEFLRNKEGFINHQDGFIIDEVFLNKQFWTLGF